MSGVAWFSALKALFELSPEERVQAIVEDDSLIDYIGTALYELERNGIVSTLEQTSEPTFSRLRPATFSSLYEANAEIGRLRAVIRERTTDRHGPGGSTAI